MGVRWSLYRSTTDWDLWAFSHPRSSRLSTNLTTKLSVTMDCMTNARALNGYLDSSANLEETPTMSLFKAAAPVELPATSKPIFPASRRKEPFYQVVAA